MPYKHRVDCWLTTDNQGFADFYVCSAGKIGSKKGNYNC